ncbi:hypothetical protein [Robertkochia solimangrovi]|uniref:hypothetical protein n=1 Tax=Robertkochia solimangrovi TaxID=2213046 RepID=UPI00117F3843|nr:hypothetical protein [Robertkochia solimangrovi]TRZ45337.1 hypothetical protein DMZ48_06225 [Robertkochia solimangrovi]
MDQHTIREGKTTALVSYFSIVGTLIAIFMNLDPKNPFARFHIRQAFGINVLYLFFGYFVGYFQNIMIFWAFFTCFFVLWVYAFTGAVQNKMTEIPVLGPYFQRWFQFIQ